MLKGKPYSIQLFCPGVVEICDEVETYRMDQPSAQEAYNQVQTSREKYASDLAWSRRLEFYEDVLAVFKEIS